MLSVATNECGVPRLLLLEGMASGEGDHGRCTPKRSSGDQLVREHEVEVFPSTPGREAFLRDREHVEPFESLSGRRVDKGAGLLLGKCRHSWT